MTLAVAIFIGLLTPLCCALAIVYQLADYQNTGWANPTSNLIALFQTAALCLLGAGAYSLDARIYGRRVVTIPKSHNR
jgi:uncharacterized membrane protein YphA (DoxX/SURF4 family)